MTTNTVFTPTEKHIHLMQHSLGINEQKREPWRNYFYVESTHPEWEVLVENGYAERQKAPSFTSGGFTYSCTEKGCVTAMCALPEPKKLTRGQQAYEEYRRSDCCESFAEWLGIEVPEREYGYSWADKGKVRLKSSRAKGEFCKTLKDAKASYKAALKAKKEGAYVYY